MLCIGLSLTLDNGFILGFNIGYPYVCLSVTKIQAMQVLADAEKPHDLVYKFARCISDKRPDSNTSLMPLDRMPFGLVQYQIEFFTANYVNQVRDDQTFGIPLFMWPLFVSSIKLYKHPPPHQRRLLLYGHSLFASRRGHIRRGLL